MTKIVGVVALLGVTALAVAGAWLSVARIEDQEVVSAPRKVPVATVLYQWYGYAHDRDNGWPANGGLGTFHWNDVVDRQLITGFVANRPDEIGYYASDNDATISWQLEQM